MKLLLVVLLLSYTIIYSQAPTFNWFSGQGTNTEEHVHEGFQTSDGGYIAIGHGIERSDADDMLIVKVNDIGSYKWKQDFGTAGKRGAGYCIAEVSDGFVAGGAIYDSAVERTQRFLAKLDLNGNVIWEKFYASVGVGGIRGIDVTDDGGFVVTGYKNTPNTSEFQGFVFIVDDGDGFIMKLDDDGNVEWEKTIDASQGTKVRQITSGYAICSTVWTWSDSTSDHEDFCLIKTDTQGNTLWRKLFGGDKSEHLYDFDLTSDGGYILGGHTVSYGVVNWDYLLMKIDSDGNEEWHKTFGQPRGYDANYIHDEAYGVRQTPDGGYVICGGSGDEHSYSESGHPSGPSDEWKVYVVRTDDLGNTLWEGIYPGDSVGNNAGEYIGLTNDGGYIVFVDTDTEGDAGPNNYGFMKLTTDPVTGIIISDTQLPEEFKLAQNYPNPFNPSTTIKYQIPKHKSQINSKSQNQQINQTNGGGLISVHLHIYDMLGRKITTLVNEQMRPGNYTVQWDASDLPSGIYYCRLQAGNKISSIKMNLIK